MSCHSKGTSLCLLGVILTGLATQRQSLIWVGTSINYFKKVIPYVVSQKGIQDKTKGNHFKLTVAENNWVENKSEIFLKICRRDAHPPTWPLENSSGVKANASQVYFVGGVPPDLKCVCLSCASWATQCLDLFPSLSSSSTELQRDKGKQNWIPRQLLSKLGQGHKILVHVRKQLPSYHGIWLFWGKK